MFADASWAVNVVPMALLFDVPSRFWTLSPDRVTHRVEVVGAAAADITFAPTTRAALLYTTTTGNLFFRADSVVATVANGMLIPPTFPYWLYFSGLDDGKTSQTLSFIASAAAQDVRILELSA